MTLGLEQTMGDLRVAAMTVQGSRGDGLDPGERFPCGTGPAAR